MYKTFIFILITLLFSCSQKNDNKLDEKENIIVERSMNDTGIPIHTLIDSITTNGSVSAFNGLQTESLDFRAGEFLSTFMIMADKYNNGNACMQVYYEIVYMYETPVIDESENGIFVIDSLNLDAKKMAIRYLKKANSLGNEEAKAHLFEYKKVGIIE